MKKHIWLGLAVALGLVWCQPASALFVNGGFENGDFGGWNMDWGYRASNDTTSISWGKPNNGLSAVINSSGTMPGQTLDVDPYNGNYMARINNIYGSYHATKIYQTDAITQADIDNGAKLYVNWGAMLIEPSNAHPAGAQPYFYINVLANGSVVDSFWADALFHNGDPGWVNAGYSGGTLWYKSGQFTEDLASYSLGTLITVEMVVSDCGWGGHGGYAFLDGIGTVKPPPPPGTVPEPGTVILLGSGLLGLAGVGRRKRG